MKTFEMTADQIRAGALKCPIQLKKKVGVQTAASGDYFAMPARHEAMKPYWRMAKKDLLDRELRGGSYKGDVGHVVIGGHRFSLYPKSQMLVRDDFALWCDAHSDEFLSFDGRERLSDSIPEEQKIEMVDTNLHQWKDIRKRAMSMGLTCMAREGTWNTVYDMKQTLSQYAIEIARDSKEGRRYAVLKMQADMLAGLIAFREKHMKDAVNFFLELSAAALASARMIQEENNENVHGEKGEE